MIHMSSLRIPLLALTLAASLAAAEFWDATPPVNWTMKEVQRLTNNSPWAHLTPLNLAGGAFDSEPGRDSGTDRASRQTATADDSPDSAQTNRRNGINSESEPPAVPASSIAIRWDSALPVRLALASDRTAPQPDLNVYRIVIADVPPAIAARADQKSMPSKTTLSAKGKPALTSLKLEIVPHGKNLDFAFTFPRETVFSAEDKEIEFTTQFGGIRIRQRFRPREMVFRGQPAL